MPIGALIAGGVGALGSVGSALIGSNAAQNASSAQVGLGEQALAQQEGMFNQVQKYLSPYISAGSSVLPTLTKLLTPGPGQTAALSQIPGFQFAQDWGQKATQNLGTTTGLGGNTLTAGANFATGLAQQGFGGIVNALQGLVNTGTAAGTGLGGIAANFGQTIGQTTQNIGSSTASGILGSASALSGGLTGSASSISNALLLSKLFGGSSGGGVGNALSGIYGPASGGYSGIGGWELASPGL